MDSAPAVTGATSGAVRDMHFSDSDGARLLHQSPAVTASSLTICRSSSQRLSAATTTGTKSSTGAVSKVCLQKFEKNYTVEKSNMLVAPLREMSIIFAPHLAYGKCMFSVEADKVAGREWV